MMEENQENNSNAMKEENNETSVIQEFEKRKQIFVALINKPNQNKEFFNKWRAVLDMEQFCEYDNNFMFFSTYLRQLRDQSNKRDQDKIWIILNDIISDYTKKPQDLINCFLILKHWKFPFMNLQELAIFGRQIKNDVVMLSFFEEAYEKSQYTSHETEEDLIFANIESYLTRLSERDIRYGWMKSFLDPEDEETKDLVSLTQMRRWYDSEDVALELIKQGELVIPSKRSFKSYVEKNIVEECWIETQKNLNEWTKLYEWSKDSDRLDTLQESLYFLKHEPQKQRAFLNIFRKEMEDHPLALVKMLSNLILKNQTLDEGYSDWIKQSIFKKLLSFWTKLPMLFCESSREVLFQTYFCIEFIDGWQLIDKFQKNQDLHRMPELKKDLITHSMVS